jgi:hypothetical protein
MTLSRLAPAVLLALASTALLGGCAIGDTLYIETESEFASTAELAADWQKTASWLPDDAIDIRIREAQKADSAVLLATTSSSLDPAMCVETERLSAPMFELDDAPSPYTDRAFACGAWTVIPTDDGWYGWTPSHPDEQAEAERIG